MYSAYKLNKQCYSIELGGSMVGLMVASSKRAYTTGCVTQIAAPRALPLWQATADLHVCKRLKHRPGSVSVGSLGPGAHMVFFELS